MAVGLYIKDAKRDDVETRIEVDVTESGSLILNVAPAQKKRRTIIEFPMEDLLAILEGKRRGLGTPASAQVSEPGAIGEAEPLTPIEVPDDMDPQDAAQILGVGEVEDDFAPPKK